MSYILDTLGWELGPQGLRRPYSYGFASLIPPYISNGLKSCAYNFPRVELHAGSSTVLRVWRLPSLMAPLGIDLVKILCGDSALW